MDRLPVAKTRYLHSIIILLSVSIFHFLLIKLALIIVVLKLIFSLKLNFLETKRAYFNNSGWVPYFSFQFHSCCNSSEKEYE